jgi:hypothetical protein
MRERGRESEGVIKKRQEEKRENETARFEKGVSGYEIYCFESTSENSNIDRQRRTEIKLRT